MSELSFGEFYPNLVNPLDEVLATTSENYFKYQYFLSLVPTHYHSTMSLRTLTTNQYGVTEQSNTVPHVSGVPGIFFKFDIEPVSLSITDSRTPLLSFTIRIVNIVGGVMVSGSWIYSLWGTLLDATVGRAGRGGGRRRPTGMIGVTRGEYED